MWCSKKVRLTRQSFHFGLVWKLQHHHESEIVCMLYTHYFCVCFGVYQTFRLLVLSCVHNGGYCSCFNKSGFSRKTPGTDLSSSMGPPWSEFSLLKFPGLSVNPRSSTLDFIWKQAYPPTPHNLSISYWNELHYVNHFSKKLFVKNQSWESSREIQL